MDNPKSIENQGRLMSVYKTSKNVRYITSVIFVIFMAFIVGGSYMAQQQQKLVVAEPVATP